MSIIIPFVELILNFLTAPDDSAADIQHQHHQDQNQ